MIDKIEGLIKKELGSLTRSEGKTLVQFLDAEGNFVCGYSEKPKRVHFYFQPLDDHPEAYADLMPSLKPYLKGKACLHLKPDDAAVPDLLLRLIKVHKSRPA